MQIDLFAEETEIEEYDYKLLRERDNQCVLPGSIKARITLCESIIKHCENDGDVKTKSFCEESLAILQKRLTTVST